MWTIKQKTNLWVFTGFEYLLRLLCIQRRLTDYFPVPVKPDFSAQCIAVIAQLVGTLSNDIMLRSQTPVTIIDVTRHRLALCILDVKQLAVRTVAKSVSI